MVRSVTCRPVSHAVPASSAPGVSSVGIIAAMADGDGLALVLVEESVVGHSSTPQATIRGRSVRWATRRPVLIRSSVPPHTGSSCSTDSTPSKPPS